LTEVVSSETAFARSVSEFLPLVTCRTPHNDAEKAQIGRLRYSAYLKEGALPPGAPEVFIDSYDDSPNVRVVGCYVGGALSSSIRLHVASQRIPVMPALDVFPDLVEPMLEKGLRILDPTRFVVDANAARQYPRLPYATVRLCAMAGVHFDIDIILATVRAEHQPFYKRLFGHKVMCEPRHYPGLAKPISLMSVNFRDIRDLVKLRYPFLLSGFAERNAIFEGEGSVCGSPDGADMRPGHGL